MKLIELTDFFGKGKECLNPDMIARIEPYAQENPKWKSVERVEKIFFGLLKKTVEDKLFQGTNIKEGSKIYLVNGDKTCVQESVSEILSKIANKAFTEF